MPICSPCFGLNQLVDLSPALLRVHLSHLHITEVQGTVGAQCHGWTHVQMSPNFCCGIKPAQMCKAQKVQVCLCWIISLLLQLIEIRKNGEETQTVRWNRYLNPHNKAMMVSRIWLCVCGTVLCVRLQYWYAPYLSSHNLIIFHIWVTKYIITT